MTIILGLLRNQVGDFRWTSETLRSTRHPMLFQKFPQRFHNSFDSELLKNILRHHNKWKPKYLDRKILILFSFSIHFFWRYTYHPLNVNGSFPTGFYKDFGAFSFWKPLVFTMGVSIQIDCDDHRNNQKEILFRGGFGGEGIFRSSWYWFPTYFNMSTLIYIKKIMSSGTGSAIL